MLAPTFSRRGQRCGVRVPATVIRRGADREREATIVDLSRTGARLRCEGSPIGEQLVVTFALPSRREEVMVFGQVIRTTSGGVAVAFLDLPEKAAEQIDLLSRERVRRILPLR